MARRPILTQCVTTGILFATGDTIAQQGIEKKGKDHDFLRTARMAGYGTGKLKPHRPLVGPPLPPPHREKLTHAQVIFGPAAANWYRGLNRFVVLRNKNAEIAARVFLDQAVFSPTFLGIFLITMGILDGHHDPIAHVRGHYWELLKTNWMVWPPVQLTNFKFVPLQHRLTFANIVAIGWNCYLSYMNSHKTTAAEEEGVAEAESVKQRLD